MENHAENITGPENKERKPRMKIYLAHNYDAQKYLADIVVPLLAEFNHVTTSRWLECTDDSNTGNREQNALNDIEDIRRSDFLMFFSDDYMGESGKGKWFELGFAMALGKSVVIIGSKFSSIFLTLGPTNGGFNVCRFDSVRDFLVELDKSTWDYILPKIMIDIKGEQH